MAHKKRYVLDSDVFITAKSRYYSFQICPGFWRSIIQRHRDGPVCSIERVKAEMLAGSPNEDLVVWVKRDVPKSFFESVDSEKITSKYSEIMLWAQRHQRYYDGAKAKFATGADGWLVAYAVVHGAIVVTLEQPAPESKGEIKLPDVCKQFRVEYCDTFKMLQDLAVRFDWTGD